MRRASFALLLLGCATSKPVPRAPPAAGTFTPLVLGPAEAACVEERFEKFHAENAMLMVPAACGWTDADRRAYGLYAFTAGAWTAARAIRRAGEESAASILTPVVIDAGGRVRPSDHELRPFLTYAGGAWDCPRDLFTGDYVREGSLCPPSGGRAYFYDGFIEICRREHPTASAVCPLLAKAAWNARSAPEDRFP
jgi:hypothetical protein